MSPAVTLLPRVNLHENVHILICSICPANVVECDNVVFIRTLVNAIHWTASGAIFPARVLCARWCYALRAAGVLVRWLLTYRKFITQSPWYPTFKQWVGAKTRFNPVKSPAEMLRRMSVPRHYFVHRNFMALYAGTFCHRTDQIKCTHFQESDTKSQNGINDG